MNLLPPTCSFALLFFLSCGGSRTTAPGPVSTESASARPAVDGEVDWRVRTDVAPLVIFDKLDRGATMIALESKERSRGVYLVRFEGLDSELDGLIFLATKEFAGPWRGKKVSFGLETNLKGQPRQMALELGSGKWVLLPYTKDIVAEVQSGARVDAEAILATYKEQKRSGRLELLAPERRAGREHWQNESFTEKTKSISKACGVPVEIDWASVKDEWFERGSVAYMCSSRLEALKEFCISYPHARTELAQLGGARCSFEGWPGDTDLRFSKGKEGLVMVPGNGGKGDFPERLLLQTLFGEDDQVLRHGENYIILKKHGKYLKVYAGSKTSLSIQTSPQHLSTSQRRFRLWAGGVSQAYIRNDHGKWRLDCDKRLTELETVFGTERETILKNATLSDDVIWKREPYYLGRDSRGAYYYVDRMREEFGGKQHRVFIGRRGQSKLTKLVGLVEDSHGTLFSTERGALRLIVDKDTKASRGTWLQGKKAATLTSLPLSRNQQLIYQSLGAYFGDTFGDVCEF